MDRKVRGPPRQSAAVQHGITSQNLVGATPAK